MGLFFGESVVGLEFDYGELRAVELGGRKGSPEIISWGRLSLPETALADGIVLEPQRVGEMLGQLWTRAAFRSRETVLGISNQGVLVRFATFPRVPEEKLKNMVRYQARDLLPFSLDEVVMDFSVVGEVQRENDKLIEILLVAAQREMIKKFLTSLEPAKLKPRDINVSSLTLLQIIPPHPREGAVAVLDLANGSSMLLLATAGIPRLARRLSSSLQDAALRLACTLDEVVVRAGAAPGEPFPDAFIDWGETLVGEVRSSINYYQAQPGAAAVQEIILSGRGARIMGLADQLQEIFEIPISIADPLQFVRSVKYDLAGFKAAAADFAVSFALARGGLGG
ncbi:MAG: pilus assembly protein PilM [Bacillota bacterium]